MLKTVSSGHNQHLVFSESNFASTLKNLRPHRVSNLANALRGGGGSTVAGRDERMQECCVDGRHARQAVVARWQEDLIDDIDVRLAHLRRQENYNNTALLSCQLLYPDSDRSHHARAHHEHTGLQRPR